MNSLVVAAGFFFLLVVLLMPAEAVPNKEVVGVSIPACYFSKDNFCASSAQPLVLCVGEEDLRVDTDTRPVRWVNCNG